jgi:hypothetical protein
LPSNSFISISPTLFSKLNTTAKYLLLFVSFSLT